MPEPEGEVGEPDLPDLPDLENEQGNLLGGIDNKTVRRSKSDVDNLVLKEPLFPCTTD